MFRLHTLGTATLSRDGEILTGAPVQQRRLALLAVIAAAGDRGVSRDTLMALLWPDSSMDKARHALAQWLFLMRRDLAADTLFVGTTMLQLNAATITSDVAEFDRAIRDGDDLTAARLYEGPLLAGFFLSDAPEFESWLDAERDRRHRDVLRAVERLAVEAEAVDIRSSIGWWQRLGVLDPYGSVAARNLIRVLSQSGDEVGALAYGQRHQAVLLRELGMSASPEVELLIRALRQRSQERTLASIGLPESLSDPYLSYLRERLGDEYTLDQLVGRTSLATIVDARLTAGHHPMTVKVFLPDLIARVDAARVVEGIRATCRLTHPNLQVPSHVGDRDGIVYAAFQGGVTRTLRDVMDHADRLPLREILATMRRVADGLACVHRAGLVHADLTPRRILVHEHSVRLTDIGFLSAFVAASSRAAHDSVGMTLGTPAYMSPEQLIGAVDPDASSDVYGFGCIFFHLLTGRPPNGGTTPRAIIAARLREPAVPDTLDRDDLPTTLRALVLRMLERSPSARPSIEEVGAELADFAHEGMS